MKYPVWLIDYIHVGQYDLISFSFCSNWVGSLSEFVFELEPELVYELFHGFELRQAYLPYFTMLPIQLC